ncbi:hypothetical protein GX48_05318 [Paracoccidioides brasiliensis]|nr:hypothetical protein GX48_05318 [Paracoccidioides brasiliensis]
MLSGTHRGLRNRVSFSRAPCDHAAFSRNEPFLPFLYPRGLLFTLTWERHGQGPTYPFRSGSKRLNSTSYRCRFASVTLDTSRKYSGKTQPSMSDSPPTDSNLAQHDESSEVDNGNSRELGGYKQTDSNGHGHGPCPSPHGHGPCPSPHGPVNIRTVRSEPWWIKNPPGGRRPKPNYVYEKWMDVMNEIKTLPKAAADKPPPEYAKTIYLSERDVVTLTGYEWENLWYVKTLSGCRVHVLPREYDSEDSMRKVVLTGSREAVKLTEEEIRAEIQASYDSGDSPDSLPPFVFGHEWKDKQDMDIPTIRSVWTRGERLMSDGERSRNPIRADEIRIPKQWTIKSFGDYVERIVNLAFSSPVHRLIYQNGTRNRVVIMGIIRDLFTDSKLGQFLSTRAVNLAIFFCYRYPDFLPDLLQLFPRYEHLMTTRTFNALLKGCSRNHDLERFRYIITLMKRFRVRPNGMEWVTFVETILSSSIKQKVVASLRKDGLLNDQNILRLLIYEIIPVSFRSHLDSGQTAQDYFEVMDRRYGHDWMCTDMVNRMLRVTRCNKDVDAAHQIIRRSKERHIQLDTQCMNFCLALYLNKGWYPQGLDFYLDFVNDFPNVAINNETVRILFSLAWKAKYYNTCRVVWRYSCLLGLASSNMRHLVLSSLLRNTIHDPENYHQDWHKKVGKVVVGIETSVADIGTRFDSLNTDGSTEPDQSLLDDNSSLVSLLVDYQPNGELRDKQRELATHAIDRDARATWSFKPLAKFEYMMWQAHEMDIAWQSTPGAADMSVDELVRRAIDVPVVKRPIAGKWKKSQVSGKGDEIGEVWGEGHEQEKYSEEEREYGKGETDLHAKSAGTQGEAKERRSTQSGNTISVEEVRDILERRGISWTGGEKSSKRR